MNQEMGPRLTVQLLLLRRPISQMIKGDMLKNDGNSPSTKGKELPEEEWWPEKFWR